MQGSAVRTFDVSSPSPTAVRRLDSITLLLLALIPVGAWGWWAGVETTLGSWITLLCTILAASLNIYFAIEAYLARHRTISVTERALRVQRPIRQHVIPLSRLSLEQASIVRIEKHGDLYPVYRSNGLHVSDYRTGWFRLRNGEKAFVILTSGDKVVSIPTQEGYRLLLSMEDPEALLGLLRSRTRTHHD